MNTWNTNIRLTYLRSVSSIYCFSCFTQTNVTRVSVKKLKQYLVCIVLVQFVYFRNEFWWSKSFSKNYKKSGNSCQKPYCVGYNYNAMYQMQWGPCNAAQGLNHSDFSPTQKFVTFVLCPPHHNWGKLFLNEAFFNLTEETPFPFLR